ncbi:O-antigen ligase family protein [Arachidicoccus sp.]|uniref:O-antigen ligase family protein n=1 Tax=Arachidicoccus sp. TaxID=1872624 RepID=UPI003D2091AA
MRLKAIKENFTLFFIAFFSFSGYNAGLAIIIGLGLNTTIVYSIPLRIFSSLLMIHYIFKHYNNLKSRNISSRKTNILITLKIFAVLYIIKIILSFGIFGPLMPYSLKWFEYVLYFLNFCVLPFFMFSSIDFNDNNKKVILDALILSGFMMALVCIFEYKATIFSGHMGRLGMNRDEGNTLTPLALSYSASLTIMLCIFQILYKKGMTFKYKIYTVINILLSIILFLLGSSKGSILAIILCIPLFFVYSKVATKLKLILIFSICVPLLVYGVAVSGSLLFDRLQFTEDNGDITRGVLWDAAKREFWQHPIIGGRIEVSSIYPHEIFLEILMATGVVGVLLFLYVLIGAFKRSAYMCKRDYSNIFIFIILIQGLAQSLVSGALYVSILIFLPMGLIFASYKKNNLNLN